MSSEITDAVQVIHILFEGTDLFLRVAGAGIKPLKQCQRRFKNVRKRRLYFVVFRRSHVTFSSVSLLKKCVYDLLLLTHEFLAFFQPV